MMVVPERRNSLTLQPARLARQMGLTLFTAVLFVGIGSSLHAAPAQDLAWIKAMVDGRKNFNSPPDGKAADEATADRFAGKLWKDYPLQCDWFLQDNATHRGFGERAGEDARGDFFAWLKGGRDNALEKKLLESVTRETRESVVMDAPAGDAEWLECYLAQCRKRRLLRLKPLVALTPKIIYALHQNMGTFTYFCTEIQGCGKGSQLRLLDLSAEMAGGEAHDELLLDAQNGIVRDPELDFDGRHLLFAWSKNNGGYLIQAGLAPATGNYKIYEMDLETRKIRQLTHDDTYGADIEPCYLPNGDILFSSDRCVQEVTCGGGDCVNMYLMDKDGKFARRVGFDQTQTGFQHLLENGRVLYTRRDYNDRAQTYAHALFTMNPDGTGQIEYYGNNTFEPTSFQHTRMIPGSGKVMTICGGYHTSQGGKLAIVDISKGRQDYQGVTFLNWDPEKKLTRGDNYGREGEQYQYPYPITATDFLVGLDPIGGYRTSTNGIGVGSLSYKLYLMNWDGKREMLVSHPELNGSQAVPVQTRKRPPVRQSSVDYRKDIGIFYVQNVYRGISAQGLRPNSIKKLRVVQLIYKPTSIGGGVFGPPQAYGPGKRYGGPGLHSITPVGVGSASFDAKMIVGEAEVHGDGSVMFEVPARTPLYFQLIDENGNVAQAMRSWATLMPNEKFSCAGCHEEKGNSPLSRNSEASRHPPQKLVPFAGVSGKPFSYAKMIQPIWNQHCVSCHAPGKPAAKIDLTDTEVRDDPTDHTFGATQRRYCQSYLTLLKVSRAGAPSFKLGAGKPNEWVDYLTRLSTLDLIPPYFAGSAKSKLITLLKDKHEKTALSRDEIDTVSAWIDLNVPFIGEYDERNDWDDKGRELYKAKMDVRHANEAIEHQNIEAYISAGQP